VIIDFEHERRARRLMTILIARHGSGYFNDDHDDHQARIERSIAVCVRWLEGCTGRCVAPSVSHGIRHRLATTGTRGLSVAPAEGTSDTWTEPLP
jgi:hypothetical protein